MNTTQRRELAAEKKASQARVALAQEEAQAALSANTCPCCGAAVRRNLAMTGWVQCAQYGAVGFRADATKPSCSWQGFTR